MMSLSANTAAIRVTQLRAAVAARGSDGSTSHKVLASLNEEIALLEKQIETDLGEQGGSEETIARPIAPNI